MDERMRIQTPEGVELELPLAGLGSRLTAALVDLVIQFVMLLALIAAVGGGTFALDASPGFGLLALVVGSLAILSGYHVLFETLNAGRTPGKRVVGIRVVRATGGPVTFRDSAVRNLLRLIDQDLSSGLVGGICILLTPRAQRLGDLAAGTVVVRDRESARASALPSAPPEDALAWDVGGISDGDVATIGRFLARRDSLDAEARARVARDLAGRLRPRVVGAQDLIAPERFLEAVYAVKARRG